MKCHRIPRRKNIRVKKKIVHAHQRTLNVDMVRTKKGLKIGFVSTILTQPIAPSSLKFRVTKESYNLSLETFFNFVQHFLTIAFDLLFCCICEVVQEQELHNKVNNYQFLEESRHR